ncbi:acyltransferase [Serratia marcescens]|uniref:Acyltransferase n=3 Tax=Enterobacterales TaxID=91347 RepID=A0A5C7C5X5_SERMA|nr:acyltransferase [Serratia marcescens]ELA7781645.1 acyltransferase [Serratia marcescens]MBN5247450.1 acyltransferase [Serratia marcescens]MBN5257489.1 acyltransferase [Serratia marcescens]MBN5352709.1 acyltransferase [Serratia marcescens]MBS3890953.1 acyltransferase [Serratia marcescens]
MTFLKMKHIKELDGLRGLMALWVVAGHAYEAIPTMNKVIPITLLNDFAVDVFIVLSGFVIFNLLNKSKVSYKKYITQRWMRLFPIYLVVLAASISSMYFYRDILTIAPFSPSTEHRIYQVDTYLSNQFSHLIPHLFLLQGIIPERVLPLAGTTIVGQAWSASVEWQFYLIAPMLFVFFSKLMTSPSNRAFLLALSFLVAMILLSKVLHNKAFAGGSMAAFLMGFISFFFYRDIFPIITLAKLKVISFFVVVSSVLLLKKDCIGYVIWFATFFAVLISMKSERGNLITKLFDNRIMQIIGKVSYSVYMVHMLVIYFSLYLFVRLEVNVGFGYLMLVPISIIVSLIVSMGTFKFIEQPMMNLGKRVSQKLA